MISSNTIDYISSQIPMLQRSPFLRPLLLTLSLLFTISSAHSTPVSVLDPHLKWQNEDGESVTLSSWSGSPVIFTMVYSDCQQTCPHTMGMLRQIANELKTQGKTHEFVIISLNPKRDTLARLRSFKSEQGEIAKNWHFLRAGATQTQKFADRLGYKPVELHKNHMFHGYGIYLIDELGRTKHVFHWDSNVTQELARSLSD